MKRVYWLALLALLTGGAARADQAVALRADAAASRLQQRHRVLGGPSLRREVSVPGEAHMGRGVRQRPERSPSRRKQA